MDNRNESPRQPQPDDLVLLDAQKTLEVLTHTMVGLKRKIEGIERRVERIENLLTQGTVQ